MSGLNCLISTRYLLILSQLLLTITSLVARNENVISSLPYVYSTDDYNLKDTELLTGLSLSVAFLVLELLSFVTGLSMFSSFASAYSILSHGIGSICLAYFIINVWDISLYWILFTFCVCLPLLFDLASVLMNFCAYGMKYK